MDGFVCMMLEIMGLSVWLDEFIESLLDLLICHH